MSADKTLLGYGLFTRSQQQWLFLGWDCAPGWALNRSKRIGRGHYRCYAHHADQSSAIVRSWTVVNRWEAVQYYPLEQPRARVKALLEE